MNVTVTVNYYCNRCGEGPLETVDFGSQIPTAKDIANEFTGDPMLCNSCIEKKELENDAMHREDEHQYIIAKGF